MNEPDLAAPLANYNQSYTTCFRLAGGYKFITEISLHLEIRFSLYKTKLVQNWTQREVLDLQFPSVSCSTFVGSGKIHRAVIEVKTRSDFSISSCVHLYASDKEIIRFQKRVYKLVYKQVPLAAKQ